IMIKVITSVKVSGKRVIVRAGFDVQLKEGTGFRGQGTEMKVVDDTRIRDILPTLKYLIKQKAKIVIVSHLDRPKGWDTSKSMWPVAQDLARIINYKAVKFSDRIPDYSVPHIYFLTRDIVKRDYSSYSKKIKPGDILFLENMRFYPGEQDNDPKFVKALSAFGDIYINDAFSVAHRKEASTYGIAKKLPSYAGVSLMHEIASLNKVLRNPSHPMVLIMGGAKVADKAGTIHHLAKHADHILVGGALGNSFLKAAGYETGKSTVADVPLARELLRNYKSKIVLPLDAVVAKSETDKNVRSVDVSKVRANENMYDIGPKSVRKFAEYINKGKTLVWNGPMGIIEDKKFSFGSSGIATAFAAKSKGQAFGVIGGGETIQVIDRAKVAEFIDHVSTGGGSMLEYLAGKKLPGIEVLDK
ncbi:MAG: phosphoglycerate kinase, partial [Candidatus Doudnabacteria bacterium]|nr:phosphoglycerate kinase [Candidatus Doudnabacteria bacterium]